MSDNYDEQIEAILAGEWELSCKLVNIVEEELECTEEYSMFYDLWVNLARAPKSLFANLPGCFFCASQIDCSSNRIGIGGEFYALVHESHPELLANPSTNEQPTRAKLEEFARRQRLCRASRFADSFKD